MRVTTLLFCAAVCGCTQRDDRTVATARADSNQTTSIETTVDGSPPKADLLRSVHRLPPDSFPSLPRVVRDTLVARRCEIPQAGAELTNVITGSFTARGAAEWAVLCSVHDTSQILVLSAATGAVVDSLAKNADSAWVKSDAGNVPRFTRVLSVLTVKELNAPVEDTTVVTYTDNLPKPIDHDGIGQSLDELYGTFLYYAEGRWIGVRNGD